MLYIMNALTRNLSICVDDDDDDCRMEQRLPDGK